MLKIRIVSIVLCCITFSVSTQTLFAAASDTYQADVSRYFHFDKKNPFTLLPMKSYQQTEDFTCGPAAVMTLMHYYGQLTDGQMTHATEMQIAEDMGTNIKTGTTPRQMIRYLEKHHFDVISGENGTVEMLKNNLKKGMPTLVEWIDWGGHWVVTAGYNQGGKSIDEDKDAILFADPSAHFDRLQINGLTMMNPDRFAAMWFDAQLFRPGKLVKGIYIIAVPKK